MNASPLPLVLSEEQLRCLVNCHSWEKYYWHRKIFESGKCPLCELPEHIYPQLVNQSGRIYKNDHWTVVVDTFAEKQYRLQTLLIVFNEHVGGLEWNTIASIFDYHHTLIRLERYLQSHFGDIQGTFLGRIGSSKHNIDTVANHYHQTFVVPDETGDVKVPIFKGLIRQSQIEERARGFAQRYEAGEIPE